jgi:hypothetical protein
LYRNIVVLDCCFVAPAQRDIIKSMGNASMQAAAAREMLRGGKNTGSSDT